MMPAFALGRVSARHLLVIFRTPGSLLLTFLAGILHEPGLDWMRTFPKPVQTEAKLRREIFRNPPATRPMD
jgi:hypothetical protein